jgi:hypothetical protein
VYAVYIEEQKHMSKEQVGRKPKGNLVKEIDAAIALLTRVRALAVSSTGSAETTTKADKKAPAGKIAKRILSADAREAIAAAQRKRWAKVRRQKKQAIRLTAAK